MADLESSPAPQRPKRANHRFPPWKVLAGKQEPSFRMEPELRLFQIKHWLTGPETMRTAFHEAALIFGVCYTNYFMGGFNAPESIRGIKDPFKSSDHRRAFQLCFRRGNLAELRNTPTVKDHTQARAENFKTDRYWLELARARMQLIVQAGDFRKETAVELLGIHRNQNIHGATTAERDKSAEPKSSFLLAADLSIKSLLEYRYTGSSLIAKLQQEVPDPETFRHFCSLIRAIDQRLRICGDDFIASAIEIPPCDLPDLPKLPSDFAVTTGRRAATETNRGKRRQPAKGNTSVG